MQARQGIAKIRMHHEIAAKGNANGFAPQQHFARNNAEETGDLTFFVVDQRRERAIEPGVGEVQFFEK